MTDQIIPRHKGARNDISAERLKEVLDYNPETGVFRWKIYANKNVAHIGSEAGFIQTHKTGQRRKIGVDKKKYMAHRLAWLWMTGEWPPFEIDHEDTDGLNNQWVNLRCATPMQNMSNQGVRVNNTSGFKGVSRFRDKYWVAEIRARGKRHRLGYFKTAEEARVAYCEATNRLNGDFARY